MCQLKGQLVDSSALTKMGKESLDFLFNDGWFWTIYSECEENVIAPLLFFRHRKSSNMFICGNREMKKLICIY